MRAIISKLGRRYVTACDVGTHVADIGIITKQIRFATGRSESDGGAWDSAVVSACDVFQVMCSNTAHVWGNPSLAAQNRRYRRVDKVGHLLADLLLDIDDRVVVTYINSSVLDALCEKHPEVEVSADVFALVRPELDVYAPCALDGALDVATVQPLKAKVVCGAANNQLIVEGAGGTSEALVISSITYAPDFLVNAGGVIQVNDELHGFDFARTTYHISHG